MSTKFNAFMMSIGERAQPNPSTLVERTFGEQIHNRRVFNCPPGPATDELDARLHERNIAHMSNAIALAERLFGQIGDDEIEEFIQENKFHFDQHIVLADFCEAIEFIEVTVVDRPLSLDEKGLILTHRHPFIKLERSDDDYIITVKPRVQRAMEGVEL